MKLDRSRGGYVHLLTNRRLVLAVASIGIGDGGYAVYSVAILWLSFQISGSLVVPGLVLLVESAMYSITFVAGPTVDRARDLRSVLVVGYGLQAAIGVALGVGLAMGVLREPLLLALVGAISLVWDFTWTANNALLPRIVSEDELFRANGLVGAVTGGNAIAGTAAGAALLLLVGPVGAMFLLAVLETVALVVVLPLSVPSTRVVKTRAWTDFREGWKDFGRRSGGPLLSLAVFAAFQGFFVQAPALLVTFLAQDRFAGSSFVYGLLFTAYAAGGVIGGLLLGRWNPRRHLTLVMGAGTSMTGLLLVAAVFAAPYLAPSILLWFGVGLVGVVFYSCVLVYLQARVPADRFGRVLTDLYLFRGIPTAVGAEVVGLLAGVWGAESLSLVVAATWIVIAAAGPALLPSLRRLSF